MQVPMDRNILPGSSIAEKLMALTNHILNNAIISELKLVYTI